MFGPNNLIGQTFYGPMPSTANIKAYKLGMGHSFRKFY